MLIDASGQFPALRKTLGLSTKNASAKDHV